MNYEDKNNRWVSIEVAKRLGKKVAVATEFHDGDGIVIYPHDNEINFDPCNNPSDAWPIIVNNKITISPQDNGKEWEACASLNNELGFDFEAWDSNPLRAAMICFLKMKDAQL